MDILACIDIGDNNFLNNDKHSKKGKQFLNYLFIGVLLIMYGGVDVLPASLKTTQQTLHI